MSLADSIQLKLKTPYYDVKPDGSDNSDWAQFVLDHLDYIKTQCSIENITETVMPEVRYNITRFLRKLAIPDAVWWIVLELNGFKNDMDFNQNVLSIVPDPQGIYMKLYVPDISSLNKLYQLWLTSSQVRQASSLSTKI